MYARCIHTHIHTYVHTYARTHIRICTNDQGLYFSTVEQYIALYDYEPQSNEELELKENDIITLQQRGQNGEWYCGQVGERSGWFPAKYVQPFNGSDGNETKKTMKEGQPF